MIRAILIVLGVLLYNILLIDTTESKVKQKITRNCLNLNSNLSHHDAEALCKDIVNGWHAHAENSSTPE